MFGERLLIIGVRTRRAAALSSCSLDFQQVPSRARKDNDRTINGGRTHPPEEKKRVYKGFVEDQSRGRFFGSINGFRYLNWPQTNAS